MKKWLLGNSLTELGEITDSLCLPMFTAKQIAGWLYKKRVLSIDEMSNLSKVARAVLAERYQIGGISFSQEYESLDGTRKYLFSSLTGATVETVVIPD